jgi:pimeloyl-ACP methyl ester carboxylesterase
VSGTLARTLRRLLALELGLYLLVGAGLVAAQGWSAGRAAVCAVGCGLVVRIGFGLATYAFAWWWRSPVPPAFRVGPVALIGHVVEEIAAFAAAYAILQPFERAWMDATGPAPRPGARWPVLLVHGYVCNRAVWRALVRTLSARGECVRAASFEPVYGAIDLWVPQLAACIDELLAATGRERVVLVTHSMGGLAARAYLRDHGGAKVARVITLGAPHHGSMHAHLGAGENARQMEPGSPWLTALAAAESGGIAAPLVSIYSHHDNFVAPQASAVHPHARNVGLAGVGHVAMFFARATREVLLREIDAANASR